MSGTALWLGGRIVRKLLAMDKSSSAPRPAPVSPASLLGAQRPDHVPPETLSDAELARSIDSLRRKVRSARRALLVANLAGGALTAVMLGAGFALLWLGPAPVFQRFLGPAEVTTIYDAAAWWIAVLLLAIVGAAFTDQLLRGRLRLARGWKNKVLGLSRRLEDAEAVRGRRAAAR